jgi:hypothetical protein
MDQGYLIVLAVALVVLLVSLAAIRARLRREEIEETPLDSPFATSTEGMKVCPNCGMGNLWTERTCASCGAALKG